MDRKAIGTTSREDRKLLMRLNTELFAALNSADDVEQIKIEKVKEAVNKGADVNCKLGGQTPLHIAVECEEAAIIKTLMTLGANDALKDEEGLTPRELAEKIGNYEIIACFPAKVAKSKLESKVIHSTALEKSTDILAHSPLERNNDSLRKQSEKKPTAKFKPLEKSYYISRILKHHVVLKNDVLTFLTAAEEKNEKRIGANNDILAQNEEQFVRLCRENPDDNVHLLTKTKKGLLVWHKTRGSIDLIAQHVDVDKASVYSAKLMDKLLDVADRQRIMLIVDQPGMGKSIILTYISHMIKRRSPLHWVSRIDLNNFCKEFGVYKEGEIDEDNICRKLFKLNSQLEVYLFGKCLRQNKAVLMLDGFDEISPLFKEPVIKFLLYLKNTQIRQLWITSRPHLESELVTVLEQLPLHLKSFSKGEQIRFLTQFWNLITLKNIKPNMKRLRDCANVLIEKLMFNLSDEDREFTGIPLLTRMLAEAYGKQVKLVEMNSQDTLCLPDVLDLFQLFKDFFIWKFDIHNQKSKSIGEERYDINAVNPLKIHQRLAIELLFPENHSSLLGGKTSGSLSVDALVRYGIVYCDSGIYRFIHRAFAEYLAAAYFASRLGKSQQCYEVNHFLLKYILAKEDYRVIRRFFEGLIGTVTISNGAIREYGDLLITLWTQQDYKYLVKTTVVLLPLTEANSNILDFLLRCLKPKDMKAAKEILSGSVINGKTGWQLAAASGYHNTISMMLKWSKEVDLPVKDMLLKEIHDGNNVFHLVTKKNNLNVIRLLWDWAERESVDFKHLLEMQNKEGESFWHLISNTERLEVFREFRRLIDTKDIDKSNVFRTRNFFKNTIWHEVAERGNSEILSTFFHWYPKTDKNIRLLMFDKGLYGYNVWHNAAVYGNLECLHFLYDVALKYHVPIVEILSATDEDRNNVFHTAACFDKVDVFKFMWKLVPTDDMKQLILNAHNRNGDTVWHLTRFRRGDTVLRAIWECAIETDIDISKLLFVCSSERISVWSSLVQCGIDSILNDVLAYAFDKNVDIKLLLKAKDDEGSTPLHTVCSRGNVAVFDTLRKWSTIAGVGAKEMLMERNRYEETPLHVVAYCENNHIISPLLAWIESSYQDVRKFLSLVDNKKNTVWHSVASSGRVGLLSELLTWCRKLNDPRAIVSSLLSPNKDGNTPWLCAAEKGHSKIVMLLLKSSNMSRKELLEQKDHLGQSAWHLCAINRHDDALRYVLVCCFKAKLDFWSLVTAKDREGNTLFHMAAKGRCARALEYMLETLTEMGRSLDDVFNDWNKLDETVFLCAVHNERTFKLLWSWLPRTQLDRRDVLLAKNELGFGVWHVAAFKSSYTYAFDYLWTCADEAQVPHEAVLLDADNVFQYSLPHLFMSIVDEMGFAGVWRRVEAARLHTTYLDMEFFDGNRIQHLAALQDLPVALRCILDTFVGEGGTVRDFLMRRNGLGRTVLHAVCESRNGSAIKTVREWVDEVPELAPELIGAEDGCGDTVLHIATGANNDRHVDAIMRWATEAGCNLRSLLTKANAAGDNVWFVGMRKHSIVALVELRKWVVNMPDLDMGTVLELTDVKGLTMMAVAIAKYDDVMKTLIREWKSGKRVVQKKKCRGGKKKSKGPSLEHS